MKITHNKVGQNLNLSDSVKTDKATTAKSNSVADAKANLLDIAGSGATRVELSDKAQEARRIKEMAMAAPDVDEAKVAKFRKMIDEGTYKVDAQALADKMVDEHLDF